MVKGRVQIYGYTVILTFNPKRMLKCLPCILPHGPLSAFGYKGYPVDNFHTRKENL